MEKQNQLDPAIFKNVPDKCGVYLMFDKNNAVLYVGKANNIKIRMQSYFSGRENIRKQIPFLLEKVTSIKTFVTFTETQALLLENNLIKKHKPRYNVLLKDDKNYTCLAINTSSTYPRISVERLPLKDPKNFVTSEPYTSGLLANTNFDLLRRVFMLRSCSDAEFKSRKRPCILFDIAKCSAPCMKKCSKSFYDTSVNGAKLYLRGEKAKVKSYLKEEINKASKKLLFEKAANLHKILTSIDKPVKEATKIKTRDAIDSIAIIQSGGSCVIFKLVFRKALLCDGQSFIFDSVASDTKASLLTFIHQHYEKMEDRPKHIYISENIDDTKDLSKLLRIDISYPKIGSKQSLVSLAKENAREVLLASKNTESSPNELLSKLQKTLLMNTLPMIIECIDTSCLSGKDSVASVVVFKNAKAEKKEYRNYHINTQNYSDDITSMKEVIYRRYSKAKALPDLILIDGGKGQLSTLAKILKELNIINVTIAALTKDNSRHDKGLTKERIFLENRKEPISLDKQNEILFFLQNVRDESHRRAITFHRSKKRKSTTHSILDTIAGIGPKKKALLLKTFGSIAGIKNSSDEDLLSIKSISKKDLDSLRNNL